MTTPAPSIVLDIEPDAPDPLDAATWIEARVRRALTLLGFTLDEGALVQKFDGAQVGYFPATVVAKIVQAITANGARVVHVLAEVPPAPASVVTWNLGDPNPPPDFLAALAGTEAGAYRLTAWDAFRFAAPVGPVYVTRPPLGDRRTTDGHPWPYAGPEGGE